MRSNELSNIMKIVFLIIAGFNFISRFPFSMKFPIHTCALDSDFITSVWRCAGNRSKQNCAK